MVCSSTSKRRKELMHLNTKKAIGKFVVATIFLAVGGFVFNYYVTAKTMGAASRSWPYARGTVVKSVIRSRSDTFSERSSTLGIEYKYQVDGREYIGDRIRYGSQSDWSVASHPAEAGKPINVYFNPDKPRISVVEPGYQVGKINVPRWSGLALLAVALLACVQGVVLLLMAPKQNALDSSATSS
jgi:hypothetical protein